ncbi:MAG TPA: thiamine pyrophosphate-binding protein [Fimbriimonas sp.]|nr:thiamine pyrophosphate-binding protein [Fimbriimonas sp.]
MKFVADAGVKHVFMLPGGGAMHLNDSLRRTEGLEFVCNLHEQASAIAAEAYCRVTENLGVALVTTGPGGTNAVTGVACAWLDSTPCLFISGQVKRSDLIGSSGLRQLGVQEIDIVSIVKPITKFAVTVMDPNDIKFVLEKALYLAKNGRPGPVWVDIPLDVQAAEIDEKALLGFSPPVNEHSTLCLREAVSRTLKLLNSSERPIFLVGNGIRVSKAITEFHRVIAKLGIPVLTTCPGLDLIAQDHPLHVGRPGAIAPRGANFALQNSDFLLSIGARLDMAFVGYSHRNFARAAKKVIVDIDPAEIEKLDMEIAVGAPFDAGDFLRELEAQINVQPERTAWIERCRQWKARYPVVTQEHRTQKESVSTYAFTEAISHLMDEGDTAIVGSSGAAIELVFLCLQVKNGQRIFHNRGTGSMGLGLPQAIGACFANGKKRTVLIEGDGSFQLNAQELQTVATHKLPIKMFILNNQGFASIRLSQNRHFGGLIGADSTSGLYLPDVRKLAEVYGIPTAQIRNHQEMWDEMPCMLEQDGPLICEVLISPEEVRAPAIASRQREDGTMASSALEDLWPFLPRDEFMENMLIPALED